MSAMFGICRWDGQPVSQADSETMVALTRHRGGPGRQWRLGTTFFGCCPPRAEGAGSMTMPMFREEAALAVTGDIRLDNRDELLAQLDLRDRPAGSVSDGEVLLHAYAKWGDACPEKLLGDFAFAIWDERRQRLFAARDHFGVRPFCYHGSSRFLAFASESRPLLGLAGVDQDLDEEQIALFLAGIVDSHEATMFRAVKRLPAGHRLAADANSTRIERYYQLDPTRQTRYPRSRDYAEAFREIFTGSIRSRLGSFDGVGCMLSGGLDSSSICCVARRLAQEAGRGPIHVFSQVYEKDSPCDERLYIDAVLAQGHFEPHFEVAVPEPALRVIGRALQEQGEIFVGPGVVANGDLCAPALAVGCHALLDGHGGDEVVSRGFGYLRELAESDRWVRLAFELHFEVRRHGRAGLGLARKLAMNCGLGARMRRRLALRRRFAVLFDDQPAVAADGRPPWAAHLHPDLLARYDLVERRKSWMRQQFAAATTEREAHYRIVTSPVHQTGFEELNRTCAARGVEPRYPFWDRRLVEFCLGLPSDQKLSAGYDRVVLRRAMKGIIPGSVRRRWGKTDFMPNLRQSIAKESSATWATMFREVQARIDQLLNMDWLEKATLLICSEQSVEAPQIFSFFSCIVFTTWLTKRGEMQSVNSLCLKQ